MRKLDQPRPRVLAGPRAADLDRLADMLAKAERPLVLVGGALLADALYDEAVYGDLRRFAEEWVLPICPTHRRPQLFDALHPNYGGYMGIRVPPTLITEMKRADLMVALGERLTDTRQPVVQLSRRAAAATAAGACLAGCQRGRPRVPARSRHRRRLRTRW